MDIKEIIQIYGLPEDASEDDVRTALKAGAQAIDDLAAERARAEASDDDAKEAKDDAKDARRDLENEKKAHDATKTALANEKAARADMALDAAVKEHRIGETARETWKTRLANEANFDESKHPRAEDGKFTSGGGGSGGASGNDNDRPDGGFAAEKDRGQIAEEAARTYARISRLDRTARAREINDGLRMFRGRLNEYQSVRARHRAAIFAGLSYNPKTHQYE